MTEAEIEAAARRLCAWHYAASAPMLQTPPHQDRWPMFKSQAEAVLAAAEAVRKLDLPAKALPMPPYEYQPYYTGSASAHVGGEAAGSPADIRAAGWAVAVHNDYRLNGEPHTFWLFTKDGRAVKGEGKTDAEALSQVRAAIAAEAARKPDLTRAAVLREFRDAMRFAAANYYHLDPSVDAEAAQVRAGVELLVNGVYADLSGDDEPEPESKPNLTDRLSAASAGFLWCVHVVGPDDVYPVRSYAEAVAQAAKMNAATIEATEETGVAVVAVPALWPHDSESHRAERMARDLDEAEREP
jgi:cytochrome c556